MLNNHVYNQLYFSLIYMHLHSYLYCTSSFTYPYLTSLFVYRIQFFYRLCLAQLKECVQWSSSLIKYTFECVYANFSIAKLSTVFRGNFESNKLQMHCIRAGVVHFNPMSNRVDIIPACEQNTLYLILYTLNHTKTK